MIVLVRQSGDNNDAQLKTQIFTSDYTQIHAGVLDMKSLHLNVSQSGTASGTWQKTCDVGHV